MGTLATTVSQVRDLVITERPLATAKYHRNVHKTYMYVYVFALLSTPLSRMRVGVSFGCGTQTAMYS